MSDKGARTIGLALVLLLIAIVMPPVKLSKNTYDYIVVFDITQSMNVEDYESDGLPMSRLDYARNAVRQALRDLPCGSRIGWGAFAEYRTLLLLAPVEVCSNYNDLLASLANIDGRMRWANSSEVGKGVYWAIRSANETGSNPHIIFLTDGQEAPPLDNSFQAASFDDLPKSRSRGWLIGTGGETPRPIPRTDQDGKRIGYWRASDVIQGPGNREHLSALHEVYLKKLAQRAGFEYTHLTGTASIIDAMRDPRFATRTPVFTDLYWLPVAGAALLLILRFRPNLR